MIEIYPTIIQTRKYLTNTGWTYDGEDNNWSRFIKKSDQCWTTFGNEQASAQYQCFGDGTSLLSTRLFDDKLDPEIRCFDVMKVLEFVEKTTITDISNAIISC